MIQVLRWNIDMFTLAGFGSMRRLAHGSLACLLLSLICSVGTAEEGGVQANVQKLNSEVESERTAAYRALLDAGSAVFPHIGDGLKFKDLDAASRAEQVVYWMLRSRNKDVSKRASEFVKSMEASKDPVIKRRVQSIARRMERYRREREAKLRNLLGRYGATVSDNSNGRSVYVSRWSGGADELLLIQDISNVKQINLYSNGFTDKEFRFIAQLKTVEGLVVNEPNLSKVGLRYITKLPKLRSLNIGNTGIDDEGMKELVTLKELSSLYVPANISDDGLRPLSQLKSLSMVSLSGCRKLTGSGLEHLAASKSLSILTLPNGGISDDQYANLAKLKQLNHLTLSRTTKDENLVHIKDLKKLTYLKTYGNQITNKGLEQLAGLTKLTTLDLSYSRISDEGLKHLHGMKSLRSLYMQRNPRISRKAVQELKKQLPKLVNVYH